MKKWSEALRSIWEAIMLMWIVSCVLIVGAVPVIAFVYALWCWGK